MPDAPVLVVVDDQALDVDVVRAAAHRQGFRTVVRGAAEPPARIAREEHARALLIHEATHGDGHLGRWLRDLPAGCHVLAGVSRACPDGWAHLLAAGVFAVVPLPVDAAGLGHALELVDAHVARRRSLFAAELAAAEHFGCAGLVGRGPAMQSLLELARRTAPWLRAALIVGEPGTGKRALARALHALGPRQARPFVVAEAPPGRSLDAVVFGAGEGGEGIRGLVDAAEGGVLHIVNLAQLGEEGQRRLLDLLRAGRSGARPPVGDVVVLVGAERHPRAEGRAGRVLPELLDAVAGVTFEVPPLRQRREDIAALAAVFAREASPRAGRAVAGFTSEAEALLHAAPWPGNVADLRATIERACRLADGDLLGAAEIAAALPHTAPDEAEEDESLPLSSVEREHILRALQRVGGNKKAAARALGLSRRALYRKLERLDLGATIIRRPQGRRAPAGPAYGSASPVGSPS